MDYIIKYRNVIIGVILFMLIVVLLGLYLNEKNDVIENSKIIVDNISEGEIETSQIILDSTIFVDVKGSVKKPGVYELKNGSIVNDAILMAGGVTKDAITSNINLSQKLFDEMVIYVFSKKELSVLTTNSSSSLQSEKTDVTSNVATTKISSTTSTIVSGDVTTKLVTSSTTNTIPTTSTMSTTSIMPTIEVSTIPNLTSSSVISDTTCKTQIIDITSALISTTTTIEKNDMLININTASKDDLMTLSGIGAAKADAIIIYRQSNRFTVIEDIKNVSGIGEAQFAKIKDFITV